MTKDDMDLLKGFPLSIEQKERLLELIGNNKNSGGGNNQGNIEGAELGHPNFNVIKAELKMVSANSTTYRFYFDGIEFEYKEHLEDVNTNVYVIVNVLLYNKILNLLNNNINIYYADMSGDRSVQPLIPMINSESKAIILNINPIMGSTSTALYIGCTDIPL